MFQCEQVLSSGSHTLILLGQILSLMDRDRGVANITLSHSFNLSLPQTKIFAPVKFRSVNMSLGNSQEYSCHIQNPTIGIIFSPSSGVNIAFPNWPKWSSYYLHIHDKNHHFYVKKKVREKIKMCQVKFQSRTVVSLCQCLSYDYYFLFALFSLVHCFFSHSLGFFFNKQQ